MALTLPAKKVRALTEKLIRLVEDLDPEIERFYPYQRQVASRILEAIINNDGHEICVLQARQSGKSKSIADSVFIAALILPELAKEYPNTTLGRLQRGVWIGIFAPKLDQSKYFYQKVVRVLESRKTKELMEDLGITVVRKSLVDYVEFSNGSHIRVQTASPSAQIEAYTYDVVVIDEAQDVDRRKIQDSILPMVAATNGNVIRIGTCGDTTHCEFYDAIQQAKARERETGIRDYFEFNWRYVAQHNPRYRQFIERELAKHGGKSEHFRRNFELEWLDEEKLFCPPDRVRELMFGDHEVIDGGDGVFVAGVDVAKSWNSTVVTVVEILQPRLGRNSIKAVVSWLETQADNYEDQVYEIIDYLAGFDYMAIVAVDATGVGEPIADLLHNRLRFARVLSCKFSGGKKSAYYTYLDSEIRAGRVILPAPTLVSGIPEYRKFMLQLTHLERDVNDRGQLVVKPSKGRDIGDDYCDSLALAIWASRSFLSSEVTEVSADAIWGGGKMLPPFKSIFD